MNWGGPSARFAGLGMTTLFAAMLSQQVDRPLRRAMLKECGVAATLKSRVPVDACTLRRAKRLQARSSLAARGEDVGDDGLALLFAQVGAVRHGIDDARPL